jgi:hypothetical protein
MSETIKARYAVKAAFTVDTPGGKRTFAPGEVLNLVQGKAAPLIMAGYLREVEPIPNGTPQPAPGGGLLIPWRTATGRLIYLAESPEAAARAPERTATFQLSELDFIKGAAPAILNLIIDSKELFGNGTLDREETTTAKTNTAPGPLGIDSTALRRHRNERS